MDNEPKNIIVDWFEALFELIDNLANDKGGD